MSDPYRVLIVDDENSLRIPLANYLGKKGFQVDTAASYDEAVQLISTISYPYDVCLLDDMLSYDEYEEFDSAYKNGIQLMHEIRRRFPNTQCILFTGWGMDRGIEALRAGAYRFLQKPFNHAELEMTIKVAAEDKRARQALRNTEQEKEWLQTFFNIGQAVTSELEFEQLLAIIYQSVGQLMDNSGMDIVLFDEDNRMLHFVLSYDRDKKYDGEIRELNEQKGLTDWVIINCSPLLINNFENEKGKLPTLPQFVYPDPNDKSLSLSWLGVPLITRNKVVGAIIVQSYESNEYNEFHKQALVTIASQVAIAVDNARLFTELGERTQFLEALMHSSFDAIVAIDEDNLITVFNEVAEELFGWPHTEMIGKTPARLYQFIERAREIHSTVAKQGSIENEHIMFKHCDGSLIPGSFSVVEIRNSHRKVCGQAGFVRDMRGIKQLQNQQQALMALNLAIAETLDRTELLQLAPESVLSAFPSVQGAEIHLYDELSGKLLLMGGTLELSPEAIKLSSFVSGEGVAGHVFKTQEPYVVKDTSIDEHYKKIKHPEIGNYTSMVCVPLQTSGKSIGTLTLNNIDEATSFYGDGLRLLEAFAAQVSIALINASLVEETQTGLDLLEAVNKAGDLLISQHDPRTVLTMVVEQACKTVGAIRASLILIDGEGYPQELVDWGYANTLDIDSIIRPDGISNHVVRDREYYFIEDTAKDSNINKKLIQDGIRAAACLPMVIGNVCVGVVWIEFSEPRMFSEAEKTALAIYVDQAASAYDNALHIWELEHLHDAVSQLSSSTKIDDVLPAIVEISRKVLSGDSAAIWSYDDSSSKFIPKQSVASGIDEKIWKRFKASEHRPGHTALTVMDRELVFVEDIADEESSQYVGASTRASLLQLGITSFLGIVLQDGDEKLGVLYVNYKKRHVFSKHEQQIAETFANHVALALKNARLLNQLDKTRDTAHVVAKVSALENIEVTLQLIADGMIDSLGSDAVVLYIHDARTGELLYPPTMSGVLYPERASKYRVPNDSIVRQMLARPNIFAVDDVNNNNKFKDTRFVREEKIKSCAVVPLIVGENRVGIIFVNYRVAHKFTKDDKKNIELFAHLAASAIRNAQLYRLLSEIKGFVGSHTATDWIEMVSKTWGHTCKRRVGTARAYIQLVRNALKNNQISEINSELDLLESVIESIIQIHIVEPLDRDAETQPVLINELVQSFERRWKHARYRSIELEFDFQSELDDLVTVNASRAWLRQGLELIIDNAVEAMEDATSPIQKIKLKTRLDGSWIVITLEDTGPGIPSVIQDDIFKRPISKMNGEKGSGIGALLAYTIFETYQGRVYVAQTNEKGTQIIIELPVARGTAD